MPLLQRILYSFLSILSLQATLVANTTKPLPTIPLSALESYDVSIFEEPLETMQIERLRFTGRSNTMVMDILDGQQVTSTKGKASASFFVSNAPALRVDFLSFPKDAFGDSLEDASLNAYLEGLRTRHLPKDEFEVLESSSYSPNGPAKFRILGQRAHTIRYSKIEGTQRIIYAENWIERDKMIHMVRVSAPESQFSYHFRDTKLTFNSLAEAK